MAVLVVLRHILSFYFSRMTTIRPTYRLSEESQVTKSFKFFTEQQ